MQGGERRRTPTGKPPWRPCAQPSAPCSATLRSRREQPDGNPVGDGGSSAARLPGRPVHRAPAVLRTLYRVRGAPQPTPPTGLRSARLRRPRRVGHRRAGRRATQVVGTDRPEQALPPLQQIEASGRWAPWTVPSTYSGPPTERTRAAGPTYAWISTGRRDPQGLDACKDWALTREGAPRGPASWPHAGRNPPSPARHRCAGQDHRAPRPGRRLAERGGRYGRRVLVHDDPWDTTP